MTCTQCHQPLRSALYCAACQTLQPHGLRANYFETLGLPQQFPLENSQLETTYHALAAELHPDFYATAPTAQRALSEQLSALLNRAYATLLDPTARANYLLSLWRQGDDVQERDLPDGFLQEMFFLQEEIEDLLQAEDYESLATQRLPLETRLRTLQNSYQTQLTNAGTTPPSSADLHELQRQLNAERYLQRLLARCQPLAE